MFRCCCLPFSKSTCQRYTSSWSLSRLKSKSIIELKGNESFEFLQGLVTNDVRHLHSSENKCLFAFMLNHLGRIVADIMVYKSSDESILIESDTRVASSVYKNFLVHKLKKKISIKMRDDLKVWTIHPVSLTEPLKKRVPEVTDTDFLLVNDPRIPSISFYRMLSPLPLNNSQLDGYLIANGMERLEERDESIYTGFRYELGMSEGASDHLTGNSFPLESNGDFLNGISFFKGCYVGQELTARTYHTGVTRKRIMPISLPTTKTSIVEGTELKASDGKKRLGKVRGIQGSLGLAVVYVEEAAKSQFKLYPVTDSEVEVTTHRPFWWPSQ